MASAYGPPVVSIVNGGDEAVEASPAGKKSTKRTAEGGDNRVRQTTQAIAIEAQDSSTRMKSGMLSQLSIADLLLGARDEQENTSFEVLCIHI